MRSVNVAATFDVPLRQLHPRRKPVRNCVARSRVSKKHGRQSVFEVVDAVEFQTSTDFT